MPDETFGGALEILSQNPNLRGLIQMISLLILAAGLYRYLVKPSWRFHWKLFEAAEKIIRAYPVVLKMAEDFKKNGGSSLRDIIDNIDRRLGVTDIRIMALLKTTPTPLFETDINGAWTWVNRAWSDLSGFQTEQTLGYGWMNVICSDYHQNITAQWKLAIEQKRDCVLEFDLVTRDERVIPVKIETTALRNNGEVIGYLGRLIIVANTQVQLIQHNQSNSSSSSSAPTTEPHG